MTLVLTFISRNFVVQASDRRLTSLDGSVFEDEENKATFWWMHGSVAYTGLARIGREPTADWALFPFHDSPLSFGYAMTSLRDAATDALKKLPRPRGTSQEKWTGIKRITFVGAGYNRVRDPSKLGLPMSPDELYAAWHKVTNFELPNGDILPESRDQFWDIVSWLGEGGAHLTWSGAALRRYEKIRLNRDIRRCIAHTSLPETVARILARHIRDVNQRQAFQNPGGFPTVGRSVTCSIVERPDMNHPGGDIHLSGNLIPIDGSSLVEADIFTWRSANPIRYIYYPSDLSQLRHYGPNWVTPQVGMVKGLALGPGTIP
jgi:hypothetical protein